MKESNWSFKNSVLEKKMKTGYISLVLYINKEFFTNSEKDLKSSQEVSKGTEKF